MSFESIRATAAERNPTLAEMLRTEGTLSDLLARERVRLRRSREKAPLIPPEGFFRAARRYAADLYGEAAAEKAERALRLGALHAADHHGALYSPQSFQGDVLFGRLLTEEGADIVPLLCFSQVPMGNATFGRGILCFPDAREPARIPLYGYPQKDLMPFCAPGWDAERLKRAEQAAEKQLPDGEIKDAVLCLLRGPYAAPEVLARPRFADQSSLVGRELYRMALANLSMPDFLFLEAEAILPALVREDMEDPGSVLYRLITDPALRRAMEETPLKNGSPVSAQLFIACDRKGRHVSVHLDADGFFRGRAMDGTELCYSAEPAAISETVARGELIPTVAAAALLLAWERGLCWFCGIFASRYLPAWQEVFTGLLARNGLTAEAEAFGLCDCAGYLSGPIYALYPVEGGAVNAGPVEWIARPPQGDALDGWLSMPLRDAHEAGLFEFYHDLTAPAEREEGWYGTLAAYAARFDPHTL